MLTDPDKMDRLRDMFASRKFINRNSDEYKHARDAFEQYARKRDALLGAIRDNRTKRPEELKAIAEDFYRHVEQLGRTMNDYLTHLAADRGGTDIDHKSQSAGKARVASARLVMEELKQYAEFLSQDFRNILNQHQLDDVQKVRVVSYNELYQKAFSNMKKTGDSNRHRKAAEKAADELKKTRGPVIPNG